MGAFNDTFRLALDAAVTNKADTVTLETEAALVATAASFSFDGNGVLSLTTAGAVKKDRRRTDASEPLARRKPDLEDRSRDAGGQHDRDEGRHGQVQAGGGCR